MLLSCVGYAYILALYSSSGVNVTRERRNYNYLWRKIIPKTETYKNTNPAYKSTQSPDLAVILLKRGVLH